MGKHYGLDIPTLSELLIDIDKEWVDPDGQPRGIYNLKELASAMQKGHIFFHQGSVLVKLPPGPIGHELTTGGPGQPIAWEPPPGKTVPTMVTDDATDITATTATLNGRMTWNGREDADHVYFDWDTDSGEPYANTEDLGPGGEGSYSVGLTTLSQGTPYYFRIRAHNSKGESCGAEKTFTTETIVAPTMTTHNADEITATTAKLHGEVVDTGWENPNRYLDWREEKTWLAGWDYRQKITVDHTKVPNTDQADFPVLITEANIKDAFWGHVKNDGSDIVVTSSDGQTKLKRELVSIDTSGKTMVLWVKADLSHTTDTELYLYYGNVSASETNDPDTWDSHFVMVHHMKDKTSSTVEDSTSYGNDGNKSSANNPAEAPGKVGKGQNFSGDIITVDDAPELDGFTIGFTIGCWVNFDTITVVYLVSKFVTTGNQRAWVLKVQTATELRVYVDDDGDDAEISKFTCGALGAGTWYLMHGVWESGQDPKFYLQGEPLVASEYGDKINSIKDSTTPLAMGDYILGGADLDGILDEVWLSKINRSGDWIKTSYNNQDSPATFYSVGSEEAYYDHEEDCGVGGVGLYEKAISGLTPSTKYYFRAKGVNSGGTGVGAEKEFTTLAS